jgi:Tn3 transposase DDE domain
MTRPIRWDIIADNYDQVIRYATAIREGTASTEAVLSRFTRSATHPGARAGRQDGALAACRAFRGLAELGEDGRCRLTAPLSRAMAISDCGWAPPGGGNAKTPAARPVNRRGIAAGFCSSLSHLLRPGSPQQG